MRHAVEKQVALRSEPQGSSLSVFGPNSRIVRSIHQWIGLLAPSPESKLSESHRQTPVSGSPCSVTSHPGLDDSRCPIKPEQSPNREKEKPPWDLSQVILNGLRLSSDLVSQPFGGTELMFKPVLRFTRPNRVTDPTPDGPSDRGPRRV